MRKTYLFQRALSEINKRIKAVAKIVNKNIPVLILLTYLITYKKYAYIQKISIDSIKSNLNKFYAMPRYFGFPARNKNGMCYHLTNNVGKNLGKI